MAHVASQNVCTYGWHVATRLEHVIARNLIDLRQARDWTQRDLAAAMSANGFLWSANRVTQIETLRRALSLVEIASLCWLFEVPLDDLLAGPDDEAIELAVPDRPTTLGDLRAALRGEAKALVDTRHDEWQRQVQRDETAAARDEMRRLGQKLGLSGEQLNELSIRVYDRRFLDEREARAGDLTGATKRSAQTSRGHASRSMLAELGAVIGDKDLEIVRENLDRDRRRRESGDRR
jgi:transcriptional regulator with XRE-family HTH domain